MEKSFQNRRTIVGPGKGSGRDKSMLQGQKGQQEKVERIPAKGCDFQEIGQKGQNQRAKKWLKKVKLQDNNNKRFWQWCGGSADSARGPASMGIMFNCSCCDFQEIGQKVKTKEPKSG